MQINGDCCRDILGYLIDNLQIQYDESHEKFSYLCIDTLTLIRNVASDKYTREDIIYSVNILAECHFIEGNKLRERIAVNTAFQEIFNVTYGGHQFYESIKPQPIWDKTKSIVSKVGVHTLGFIEGVAHDIAVESAKQAVTISMSQK